MHSPRGADSQTPASFCQVVDEHWEAVFRLLHSLTGSAHDSEDLTQETFLRAMNRLDSFQPGTNMRSWLMRIASNAYFDVQRKRKRSKSQPLPEDLPTESESPDHQLIVAQEAGRVRAAMANLTALTRLVFHLRATEDLSFREIAEVAGTTEQAARWHMHHARSRLLEILGEESP